MNPKRLTKVDVRRINRFIQVRAWARGLETQYERLLRAEDEFNRVLYDEIQLEDHDRRFAKSYTTYDAKTWRGLGLLATGKPKDV